MNNDSIGAVMTVAGVTATLIAGIGMIPMIAAVASNEPLLGLSGPPLRVLGTFGVGVLLYLFGRLVEYQSQITDN